MMDSAEYQYLLSAAAIRERAGKIFEYALEDKTHFRVQMEKLNALTELTIGIIRDQYPDGQIPLHSRWRHFIINGVDHSQFLQSVPPLERAKSQLDLAMISVLLDAGAGSAWHYRDQYGQVFGRSEGLAVASLALFAAGEFSADPRQPWRVDGEALQRLSLSRLEAALQVSDANPLLGLTGRLHLLQNLGKLLSKNNTIFLGGRPGGLYDYLLDAVGKTIAASDLLTLMLLHLNAIWSDRSVEGYALGDMWEYPPLGWIPFHKLTLWLTLSLIEPLQTAGLRIEGLEQLPGLAEYRNGGLFIDGGVLAVKDPELLMKEHTPADKIIIEWRALTIALLEKLALLIRKKLGVDSQALPLVNILQGGTWQAGRLLAFQRSAAGDPPLRYQSTGTVF